MASSNSAALALKESLREKRLEPDVNFNIGVTKKNEAAGCREKEGASLLLSLLRSHRILDPVIGCQAKESTSGDGQETGEC